MKKQQNQENENLTKIHQPSNNNKNSNNLYLNKSYNPNYMNINERQQHKFNSGDEFLHRTKNLFTINKTNSNDLEPHDNNRRSSNNKYYIDSGMKPNINKSYNKTNSNTIIINNNIHINTFIDKNNIKNNIDKNMFLNNNNNATVKKINEIYNEPLLTNNFKNIINK